MKKTEKKKFEDEERKEKVKIGEEERIKKLKNKLNTIYTC